MQWEAGDEDVEVGEVRNETTSANSRRRAKHLWKGTIVVDIYLFHRVKKMVPWRLNWPVKARLRRTT